MPFQQGNTKLGKKIWTFSIPAGDTCPYKTEACAKECYAAEGFFLMPNVKKSLQKNWDETKSADFVQNAVDHLKKVGAKVCRVHVAGDLYDVEYADKWLEIFRKVPECRFFIFTRSWRGKEFVPVIKKMARLSNVKMWLSLDKDTGKPTWKSKHIRTAYMQVAHDDVPKYKVNLVFRVDRLYNVVSKKIAGGMVCPVENGVTDNMNCMKCGFCWRNKGEQVDWSKTKNAVLSLPVIAGA